MKHRVYNKGFQIQVYMPWLRFNNTFALHVLPRMAPHAWESIEELFHPTKTAPHSTMAFFAETNSCKLFHCFMKSSRWAESTLTFLEKFQRTIQVKTVKLKSTFWFEY